MKMQISRREANRLARRKRIIAVALEHFLTHGFAGTGMNAIAAKLGGSKATLWRYFPSKEALLEAVVEETSAAQIGRIDFSCSDQDPMVRLTRLCRSIIDNFVSPLSMAMCRLMYSEASRLPEVAKIFYERGTAQSYQVVADGLAKNFGDVLEDTDLMAAARMLTALCLAGVHSDLLWGAKKTASIAARNADAQTAAKMFLRTYGKEAEIKHPSAARHGS